MSIKTLIKRNKKKLLEKEKFCKVKKQTLFINNSYCTLVNFSKDILEGVEDALRYENEGVEQKLIQKYRLRKMAYSRGQEGWARQLSAEIKDLEENKVVCLLKNGQFPTGLLAIVKEELKGQVFDLVEERKKPKSRFDFKWKVKPFDLRYYQKEAVDLAVKQGRGVLTLSVGAGKSLIMQNIIKELGVTALIIVPASGLLEQLFRDFEEKFGTKMVEQLTTAKIKKGGPRKPISLITVQSLASLNKQGLIKETLAHVESIHLEEFHHSASKSYTDLLKSMNHIYYRFGYTGTNERADSKTLDLWGVLSNELYHYPAYRAIEEGFLTPLELRIYELEGKRGQTYQKEYKANYEGSTALLEHVESVLSKIEEDKQVLILIDRKSGCGDVLFKYLKNNGFTLSYISGDDKKEVIIDHIEAFNEKKVKILIGSSVIGEGIDLKTTDHLILARGGKSPIQITQALGRAVRLSPGKDLAIVHDIYWANTKWLSKHCEERADLFANRFAGKIVYES